ncbi:hypothetical protein GCM10010435_15950 [Winogradskya consettensis]|uniref:Uncharacterized protein n=1 Tax=Winogradskya consettensis TaxID=113560 RepID=A0A919SCM8_9ACTN|nr:hypothetical protein Aco04nite_15220 [Actinoplanes consettensis]
MIPMPHSLFATPAPAHQGTPVRVMTIPGTFIAAALGVAKPTASTGSNSSSRSPSPPDSAAAADPRPTARASEDAVSALPPTAADEAHPHRNAGTKALNIPAAS